MTVPTHHPSPTNKTPKMVWLIATVVMMIVALVIWAISTVVSINQKTQDTQIKNEQIVEDTGEVSQVNLVQSIEDLHELADDVAPIGYDTVIHDINSYPVEFKDSKYLTRYKGKWTLQVMTVNENDIIKDYLETRNDREKFAYFRYLDAANQKKYVLTYGVMDDAQEAADTIGQVDFGLPASISILPVEIKRYIKRIDNYERVETLVDLATGQREIKLVPTRRQVPARTLVTKVESDDKRDDASVSELTKADTDSAQTQTSDVQPNNPTDEVKEDQVVKAESTTTDTDPVKSEAEDVIEQKIEQITTQTVSPKANIATSSKTLEESSNNKLTDNKPAESNEPAPKPFIPDEAP